MTLEWTHQCEVCKRFARCVNEKQEPLFPAHWGKVRAVKEPAGVEVELDVCSVECRDAARKRLEEAGWVRS